MLRSKIWFGALALLLQSAPIGAEPAERDWGATLREDAQALHDDIAANHPGPANPADPGFAQRNDAELARALERARDARTYGDYFFALRQYVSSFNDGHMAFGVFGNTPNDYRWPGFVTEYDGQGAIRVVEREEDAPVPLGARLAGCDGMTAEQYASATLGQMWGRWELGSQRQTFGRLLFLDEGSRYIPQAERCTFDVAGEQRIVALNWRPVAAEKMRRLAFGGPRRPPATFDTRILPDGTRWYAIPSFNARPQSTAGQALPGMIERMRADRAEIVTAPAIVLDLRRNDGGSSDWSRQIAEVLWGRPALGRLRGGETSVDWRVSRANLDIIEQRFAEQSGPTLSSEMRQWFETVIAGLRGALARGDRLWRHPSTPRAPDAGRTARREAPPLPLRATVYLVTDETCMSACLDAVDLWRALGAVHVGRTTGADTLYMEVRPFTVPSGLGRTNMPMKVYSGRARGANEPAVPVHRFDGDMSDTAALERWIATLAARDHRPSVAARRR
jgi:hypothetical protein